MISSFGGSSGEDSGYAGSPIFGTVDPSHLSMGNDFTLFEPEQSTNSVRFTEDTKTSGTSSQEPPVQPKKEVKKRKSWGQPLAEPTTNLPPRYIFLPATDLVSLLTTVLESVQRPRLRRSSAESSASSVIAVLPNHHASASARKLRSSNRRRTTSHSAVRGLRPHFARREPEATRSQKSLPSTASKSSQLRSFSSIPPHTSVQSTNIDNNKRARLFQMRSRRLSRLPIPSQRWRTTSSNFQHQ